VVDLTIVCYIEITALFCFLYNRVGALLSILFLVFKEKKLAYELCITEANLPHCKSYDNICSCFVEARVDGEFILKQ